MSFEADDADGVVGFRYGDCGGVGHCDASAVDGCEVGVTAAMYGEVDSPIVGDDERSHVERVRCYGCDDEVVVFGHHDWSADAE